MVEAAIPGEQSAEQSNTVGNTLAEFFNHLEGDQTVAVIPESLSITNKIDKGFVGETHTLECETLPSESTYKSLIYTSSNPDVASINNDGVISFLSVGTTTIYVYNEHYPSISDNFDISIYNVEATKISSSILNAPYIDDYYTIYFGKEYSIQTLFTPINTTIKDLTYSYDEKYISISNDGVITPVSYTANKTTEIKVHHSSLESTLKIKVDYEDMILLNSLSLSMKNKIYVTESVAPKVIINPANATFGSYTLYSSDTSVAKINKNSVVGVKEGNVTITVKSNVYDEILDIVDIEVLPQPPLEDFNVTTKSLFVNDEVKLKYKLIPEYATPPSNISYESMDTSIATISNKGVLKGVSSGKVNIKVTMDSIVKTFEINVVSKIITGDEDFDINVKDNYLNYGQEYLISDVLEISKWYPSDPIDSKVTYTLQNNSDGKISGNKISLTNLGENTLFITHDYTGITKSITLNCVDYNYLIVDSNQTPLSNINMIVNEVFPFSIYDNQPLNKEFQTYELSSSDESIVSITKVESGYEMKALDEGEVTLNIKSFIEEKITNNISLTVNTRHIYSSFIDINIFNTLTNELVNLSNNNYDLYINNNYSINTILSNDITIQKIRYTSLDESVLTIDNDGNFIFNKTGTTKVLIQDLASNLSKEININVVNFIKLNEEEPYIIKGETIKHLEDNNYSITNGYSCNINLNFDENSTYKNVSYSSSDETVATIGKDGTITPLKEGETIITLICDDGTQEKIEIQINLKIKKQDYIKNVTDFIYKVRKGLGHFSAFLILGIVSTFTWLLMFRYKKLLIGIPVNYVSGFIIACITELIQVYVPGRCGLFDDVILDYNGFLVSSSILTVLIIIHQIRVHIKYKKQDI